MSATPTDLDAALQAICEGEWTQDGDQWETDTGDGLAWTVWETYGFVLTRVSGWYEQRGDADTVADLVPLARAMDAAANALLDSLEAAMGKESP